MSAVLEGPDYEGASFAPDVSGPCRSTGQTAGRLASLPYKATANGARQRTDAPTADGAGRAGSRLALGEPDGRLAQRAG